MFLMKRIVLILMVLLFSCKKDKPVEYLLTVKTVDRGSVSTTGGTYYYQCSLHAGMVGTITIQ